MIVFCRSSDAVLYGTDRAVCALCEQQEPDPEIPADSESGRVAET